MFSSLSAISTTYLFCIIFALVVLGFVIQAYKPNELFGAAYASQIAFGTIQIVFGVVILALAFAVIRKFWF
jgi:uncharacterized membrane protein